MHEAELRGLLEFTHRHPSFRPLLVCDRRGESAASRAGIEAISWSDFLLAGPPGTKSEDVRR